MGFTHNPSSSYRLQPNQQISTTAVQAGRFAFPTVNADRKSVVPFPFEIKPVFKVKEEESVKRIDPYNPPKAKTPSSPVTSRYGSIGGGSSSPAKASSTGSRWRDDTRKRSPAGRC